MGDPDAHTEKPIGSISEKAHTIAPDTPVSHIKTFFDRNKPVSAVVILDAERICGLVMNIHLNYQLSQRYGFSLFYEKPITNVMDKSPMLVDYHDSIEDVAAAAMERNESRLYDHIIITRDSRLYGIVPVRKILNALVRFQLQQSLYLKQQNLQLQMETVKKERLIKTLQESRKMFQLVIDTIPHAVFWKDIKSRYLGCNLAFARDAGFDDTQSIHHLTDYDLPWTDKEAQLFIGQDRRIMSQNCPELNVRQVQTNFRGEKRFLNINKIPLHDQEQRVVGVLCFYQDITQRLRDDNRRSELEKQLARAQKMEAIGRLAGGVAHDLNNILSAIVNYPELIMMDLPKDSALIPSLKSIQNAGERAAAVVQDLLTLARRGVMKHDLLHLNTLLFQYLDSPEGLMLKRDYPGIDIHISCAPDLLPINGSSVHLVKTIMNIVHNAVESISGTGQVHISTQNRYIDAAVQGYDSVNPGDYVILSVTDTGSGIDPDDLERIFEPFYTKKKMGRSGTGLGMSVVWGTVKDHNGYIHVGSEPEKGTTVTLYFPSRPSDVVPKTEPRMPLDLQGQGESILVVDDVTEQREIAANYLKRLNYHVKTVDNGEAAVSYLRSNTASLLVLDMIMEPGMDGLETYMRILEIHPGQRAIITSGFSESNRVKEAKMLGVGSYLRKPYQFQELGMAVKNELKKSA